MPFPSECPACKSSIEVPAPAPAEVVCPACGKVLSDPERTAPCSPPDRPVRLGRYEILEEVGSGSFGTVYRARDTELDRIVALKAPRAGALPQRADLERFLREAKTAAQLRHPGIVLLYDAGWIGDTFAIASEFVEGATLSDHLTAKRFTPRESAELVALAADAVDHAHRRGVIHRDLKPSNIMLDPEGRPHVMDFGLAKRLRGDPTVTIEGQVLGTPAYMSPEQARGDPERVEARSDVYSLGVILYELLTGELPFRGNARMVLLQVVREEPRPPRRVNDRIPRDLETICLKAMSREPGRRYPTAAALADDLRRFLDGRPVLTRPAGRVLRMSRWCRRNPAVATLLSIVILLLAGTAAGATMVAVTLAGAARKERELRDTAGTALRREEAERIRAEGMAEAHRLSDYVARVNLAQRAFLENDVVRARALLESLIPAAGQKDLRGFEWYHLWKSCRGELLALQGHPRAVQAVAYTGRGDEILTASRYSVRLWDSATGELRRVFARKNRDFWSLAVSPDGRRFAAGSGMPGHASGQLRVWSLEATDEGDLLFEREDFAAPVLAVAWSPDGRLVATGTAGVRAPGGNPRTRVFWIDQPARTGELELWDAETGERRKTLEGTTGGIRIVDAGTLEIRTVLRPQGLGEEAFAQVKALAFSPRGDRLAAGWWGTNAIQLWRTSDWATETTLEGHDGTVAGLAFAARADLLASGSWDQTARLWDLASGREVCAVRGHRWGLNGVAVGAEGGWLAAGGGFGDPRILEWRRGSDGRWEGPAVLGSHADEVTSLETLDDGSILTASWDGRIAWWGPPGDRKARSFPAHDGPITSLAVAGKAGIVVTASDDRTLKAWSLEHLRRLPDAAPELPRRHTVRHDPSRGLDLASLVREERWEDLESGATRVAELYGASREIHSFLAISRRARGDRAGAEEAIGGHLRFCPGCAWALAFLATTREESRRWGPAREALEALVESKPRDPWALNRLAWFLVTAPPEHRDPALALTLARKAVALEPGSHAIANTLGAALYRNGDPAGAIATLEEARRTHPGGGLPHDFLLLAMAHRLLGDRDAAGRCLDRARAKLEGVTAADGSLPRDLEELRAEAEALLAAEASPTPGEPTPGR